MTEQEAIRRLKNTAWLGTEKDESDTIAAMRMAISALEKQISKKPTIKEIPESLGGYVYPCCPVCDYHGYLRNYCPECGTKLDWSDIE